MTVMSYSSKNEWANFGIKLKRHGEQSNPINFIININNENEIVSKAREKVNEKLKNCST